MDSKGEAMITSVLRDGVRNPNFCPLIMPS
jgi:hypothetical protein